MAMRLKTFMQILMAVLALGMGAPQSVCSAGTLEPGKTCCCTETPTDKCQPDKPCQPSCTLVQVQASDKQVPPRVALTSSLHGGILLYSIAPTQVKYLVFVPVVHQRELNASPPFGGSPPQAVLCLWLI